MNINLKCKPEYEKTGTEFMDLPPGTYLTSLDRDNKNRILIFTDDHAASAICVKDDLPARLAPDTELFNIVKVKLTGINLEEI